MKVWVCISCSAPMTRPIVNCDEYACLGCGQVMDGWYPPLARVKGVEVEMDLSDPKCWYGTYNNHAIERSSNGIIKVDGKRGPLGLTELVGVTKALGGG